MVSVHTNGYEHARTTYIAVVVILGFENQSQACSFISILLPGPSIPLFVWLPDLRRIIDRIDVRDQVAQRNSSGRMERL